MIAPLEDSLTVRNYVITKSSLDYNVVFIHFCEQLCSKCILNSGFSIKEFRKFTENFKKVPAAFLPEPFFMVPFIYGTEDGMVVRNIPYYNGTFPYSVYLRNRRWGGCTERSVL